MEDTLVGLISGSVSGLSGRIYPLVLPQNSDLPACTYQRISTEFIDNQDSGAGALYHGRVQFSVYGETFGSVRTQSDGIISLFNRMSTGTIQVTYLENTLDDIEEETGLRKAIIDIDVWTNL